MRKIKLFGVLILFVIGILASGIVSADANYTSGTLGVTIKSVEVDGTDMMGAGTVNYLDLEKGEEIEVKVVVTGGSADIDDAQIEVYMRGYDHTDLIDDITDVFDIKAGVSYSKKLTLKLSSKMDQDDYNLRVRVESRSGDTKYADYKIRMDTKRHLLYIKDIVLNPEDEVQAGRALLATVRVKNRGESKEEDIKIKVSIPALGISASDYIDELDPEDCDDDDDDCDDSTTSEELYLRIPADAVTGEYTVKAEVEYDDGDEKETETATINIVGEEEAAISTSTPKTIIAVPDQVQDITKGGSAVVYPITITNSGATARTYTITANGANWADFTISPSNAVVIDAGESKALYISVAAKETATAGENTFAVTIKSDDAVLKEIPLKANVLEGKATGVSLKRALEVALVILVVLIVIIGLIIGLSKLKGKEEETEGEEKETYY